MLFCRRSPLVFPPLPGVLGLLRTAAKSAGALRYNNNTMHTAWLREGSPCKTHQPHHPPRRASGRLCAPPTPKRHRPPCPRAPLFARAEPRRVMAACRLQYRAASQCRAGLRRGRALWPWPAAGLRQYICPPAAALGCLAGLLLFQPLDTALKLAGACIGALTARIVGRQLGQTGFLPGAACGVGVLLLEQGLVTLVGGASPADTASLLCSAVLAVLVGLGHPQAPHRHPARGLPVGRHGRRLFAARCPAGVCAGAGGGGVLHFVLCLRGQPGAHRRTGSCACHGPDRCRPGALFCRAGRGCGRAGDSGLLPRRAPRGRRICCRVCAGAAGRPQPDRRTHLGLAAGAGLLGFLLCPEQALRAVFPPPAPPVGTQSLTSAARKLSGVADTLSDIAETVNAVCSCQMPPPRRKL